MFSLFLIWETLPTDDLTSVGLDIKFALIFGNAYIYESNHITCLAIHSE